MRKSLLAILLLCIALIRADAAPPFNSLGGGIGTSAVPVTNNLVVAMNEPTFSTPSDNPALPAGVDTFNPSFTGSSPSTTEAQVSRITALASRSQAVAATGYQFDGTTNLKVYGQTSTVDATLATASSLRLSGNRLATTLPNGLPAAAAMYIAWPTCTAGVGYGNPVLINHTEANWIQCSSNPGVRASQAQLTFQPGIAGDTVYVRGRNLSQVLPTWNGSSWDESGCKSYVYVQPASGSGAYVTTTYVNPYDVEFAMPALSTPGTSSTSIATGTGSQTFTTQAGLGFVANDDVIIYYNGFAAKDDSVRYMKGTVTSYSGTTLVANITETSTNSGTFTDWTICRGYQVWVHNGHGGKYGWSKCPQILFFATAKCFGFDYSRASANAPAPSGGDDLAALETAMATLTTGGTLNLQAGTYQLSDTLPVHVAGSYSLYIKGAGKASTKIQTQAGFNNTFVLDCHDGTAKISDLTIDVDTHNPTFNASSTIINGAVNVQNVEIDALTTNIGGGQPTIIGLGHRPFTVTGCTIKGNNIFTSGGGSTLIDSNTFVLSNDTQAGITIWGTDCATITNNSVSDYNNASMSTRGAGRMFVCDPQTGCENHYIAKNSSTTLTPDSNTGEQILYDGGSGVEVDTVSSAANSGGVTVITCASIGGSCKGRYACITAGTGAGQVARILTPNVGAGTLTLDRTLAVLPDATSLVNVVGIISKAVSYDNRPTSNSASVGSSAACGFAVFSGGSDVVCDGTTNSGTLFAFYDTTNNSGSACQPCFFNIYENFHSTNMQGYCARFTDGSGSHSETSTQIGAIVRGCAFTTAGGGSAFQGWWLSHNSGTTSDLLISDGNTYANVYNGIYRNTGLTAGKPSPNCNVITHGDTYTLGTCTLSGSLQTSQATNYTVTNSGTTFTGFSAP